MDYGISESVKKETLKKIKKQRDFLKNNYFQIGNDNIPMSAVVKNALNNSSKYIAEVNQRVYSLYNYANNKGLKNIFGTITLPSEYHKKIGNKTYNPKFANKHLHDKKDYVYCPYTKKNQIVEYHKYTPNAGAKKLSKIFKSLLDSRAYQEIEKDDKCYFRVYEPHKDGTPHLHFSMFVPADKVEDVAQKFRNYFSNNHPSLRVDFQTNIDNPVAYLMKYILKTFDDLREDSNNISNLSLWYVANKITRFSTSRTLVSLDVFRKLNGRYNLLELTEMYRSRELRVMLDIDTNKIVSIHDNLGRIYNKKDTKLKEIDSKTKLVKKRTKYPDIIVDGVKHKLINGELEKFAPIPIPSRMSNKFLVDYYENLNNIPLSDLNVPLFNVAKNEMIKRGLLNNRVLVKNISELNFDSDVLSDDLKHGQSFITFDNNEKTINNNELSFSLHNTMEYEPLCSVEELIISNEYGF